MSDEVRDFVDELDRLFAQIIEQQRAKALKLGRSIRPNFTDDDMNDPHSHPEVCERPDYAYEDGMLNGFIAAQVAVMREAHAFLKDLDEEE